jgi:hypothetical protein
MKKKIGKPRNFIKEIRVKPTVGRSEKIHLPEFNLTEVDAKIDTGAYGCAIHCNLIEVVKQHGEKMLRIIPLRGFDHNYQGMAIYLPLAPKKRVKNSMGGIEERYIIKTKVAMFGEEIETVFSLTDRSRMKFPVLLGRKFLQGRFLVDVSLMDRSIKAEKKKSKAKNSIAKTSAKSKNPS